MRRGTRVTTTVSHAKLLLGAHAPIG
ncbi:hypothetical protein VTH82DRAFT_8037 [Thermothelomyces myriococcoides]